jgi:hypothetical protein
VIIRINSDSFLANSIKQLIFEMQTCFFGGTCHGQWLQGIAPVRSRNTTFWAEILTGRRPLGGHRC